MSFENQIWKQKKIKCKYEISAFNPDGVRGTRFTLPPPMWTRKQGEVYEEHWGSSSVFGIDAQWTLRDEKQMVWVLWLPWVTALIEFLGHGISRENLGRAWWTAWVGEMELGIWRNKNTCSSGDRIQEDSRWCGEKKV